MPKDDGKPLGMDKGKRGAAPKKARKAAKKAAKKR
jgi:hypothetical protein